jgi:hypothetical protein
MNSIISQFKEFCNKILCENSFFNKIFWLIFFCCFSISSFFLGRISKIFENIPETSLDFFKNPEQQQAVSSFPKENYLTNIPNKNGFTIVASKSGKKYHFIWCKSSQGIKPANRIYFKTEEDAKKRGLTLAASCK